MDEDLEALKESLYQEPPTGLSRTDSVRVRPGPVNRDRDTLIISALEAFGSDDEQ